MELRQLEYFREIADTGSINEAARRLMGEDVPLELPKVRPQFSRRLKSSIRVLRGAQEPEREE